MKNLINELIAKATLTLSAGKSTPLQFHYDERGLWLLHDRKRSESPFDPDNRYAYAALGAAIENICIGAAANGFRAELAYFPYPPADWPDALHEVGEIVAKINFTPCHDNTISKLAALHPYTGRKTPPTASDKQACFNHQHRQELLQVAGYEGCKLTLLETSTEREQLSRIISEGRQLQFSDPHQQAELMQGMQWSEPGAIRNTSAIGLFSMTDVRPGAGVRGGQTIESLWLTAIRSGLTIYPLTGPMTLLTSRAVAPLLISDERDRFSALTGEFYQLFPGHRNTKSLFMFLIE
ncbi:MAG: hypothetical protein R3F02_22000 [Thiolinea sp.]